MTHTLHLGDCRDVLATLPAESVDAIVCDPPYGLSFMGSGSTGCAAVREGFDFVGIDLTPEYVAIAQKRIDWHAVTSPLDNIATMELHEENDA